jgi:hypothetical protein
MIVIRIFDPVEASVMLAWTGFERCVVAILLELVE